MENYKKIKNVTPVKEMIMAVFLAVVCMFLVSIFPRDTGNIFQEIVISLTFLIIVPALYIKIILKKKLSDYGLRTSAKKSGIIWTVFSIIAAFLVFYIVFQYTAFSEEYRLPQRVVSSFGLFIAYQVTLVGLFSAIYEFFFRGFLMFSFEKKFGFWSVFMQFLIFFIFLAVTIDDYWVFIPYLIAAFFSGIIAYKSRSIIRSFQFSVLFLIIVDALIIGLKN